MGYGITAVCTIAAYTYTYTEYGFELGDFGFTGIVNGGNCSFTLNNFYNDAGSLVDIYNVTSAGQMTLEDIHCNISTSQGCSTSYTVFTGLPYQYITFQFDTINSSGTYDEATFSYFILPPVPSQPPEPMLLNAGTQVQFTTSMYSAEYGAPLIGCAVAAGPTVWSPAATAFPATLSSTPSANSLPYQSYAVYAPPQNTNVTVNLTAMNLSPGVVYDFWALCYNSNGQSPHSILFNSTSSSSLPLPVTLTLGSSSSSSSLPSPIASSSSSAASVVPTGPALSVGSALGGNFESPTGSGFNNGGNNWAYNPAVTALQPWTFTPMQGGIAATTSPWDPPYPGTVNPVTPSPAQYAYLQTNPGDQGISESNMSATVTGFTSGQQYNISFYYGTRSQGFTANATQSQLTVFVNSQQIYQSAPNLGDVFGWTPESALWTATGSSAQLVFQVLSTSQNDRAVLLDSVLVLPAASPAPSAGSTAATSSSALSFQSPNLNASSYGAGVTLQSYMYNPLITATQPWAFTPFQGGIAITGSPFDPPAPALPPSAGGQYAFIQVSPNGALNEQTSSMSTTLTGLTAGSAYALSFYTGTRANYGQSSTLTVLVNGQAVYTSQGNVTDAGGWSLTTSSAFTPSSSSVSLQFLVQEQSNLNQDGIVLIDAVSVAAASSPPGSGSSSSSSSGGAVVVPGSSSSTQSPSSSSAAFTSSSTPSSSSAVSVSSSSAAPASVSSSPSSSAQPAVPSSSSTPVPTAASSSSSSLPTPTSSSTSAAAPLPASSSSSSLPSSPSVSSAPATPSSTSAPLPTPVPSSSSSPIPTSKVSGASAGASVLAVLVAAMCCAASVALML